MSDEIRQIYPIHLEPAILRGIVYPDLDHHFYWSDSWDPGFYVSLARAGFISICHEFGPKDCSLVPELQTSYALLDWPDRHCSRSLRRQLRSGWLEAEALSLRLVSDTAAVAEGIGRRYGADSWLLPPYRQLLRRLEGWDGPGFRLLGTELWADDAGRLLGGEIGYTCGAAYTSLSGFISLGSETERRRWGNCGKVQLLALSFLLEACGYAFWNLGPPNMRYKLDLGCRLLPRREFLRRWLPAVDARPATELDSLVGRRHSCSELLAALC
jgi:hypothetical protein